MTTREVAGAMAYTTHALEWRLLAEQRLDRLVLAEHHQSVLADRVTRLQVEHAQLLVCHEQCLAERQVLRQQYEQMLAQWTEIHQRETALLNSSSWRITRPLRQLAALGRISRLPLRVALLHLASRLARHRHLRKVLGLLLRSTPRLRGRLVAALVRRGH